MEDEVEEEDVFLEHSQLFHYMQECEPKSQTEIGCSRSKKDLSAFNESWVAVKNLVRQFVGYCGTEFRKTFDDEKLVAYYLNKHGEDILNSCVLVEEDASFLENFFMQTLKYPKQRGHIRFLNLKCLTSSLALLLSYVGLKWINNSLTPTVSCGFKIVESTVLFGMSCFIAYNLLLNFVLWKKEKRCSNSLNLLNHFLKQCEKFAQNVRKCLTYIQEMEVIGRGMLLTNSGTTFAKLEQSLLFSQRLSVPDRCLYSGLRLCLFRQVRQCIKDIKITTIRLLELYPLRKEIDKPNHYISFIEEEEIGPLLTVNINDEKEVLIATDNLSVSAIKSLCQLLNVQLSEMLRRLALCFFPEPFLKNQSIVPKKDAFWIVSHVIEPLNKKLNDASTEIDDCFTFQTTISRSVHNSSKQRSQVSSCPTLSLYGALITSLRSLARHTEVSLARIQEFIAIVEEKNNFMLENSHEDKWFGEDNFKMLNNHLELINDDIEACRSCWEESSLRLVKMFNKSDETNTSFSECATKMDVRPPIQLIQANERTDVAPKDQVFEAYIDRDDYSLDADDRDFSDLELTLMKKTLEAKRISQNMFKELKNVLKPRAKQWEEREAKALGVPSSTDRVDTAQSLDDVNTSSSEHNDQPSLNPLLNPTSECNNQAKEEQAVVDDADAIKHELKNVFEWSSSSSIAAMVAQQSKMLNLSTCQEGSVFAFDGDASCDEDSSDSEGS